MIAVMQNIHRLNPCRWCPIRMAVPGTSVCTMCQAHVDNEIAEMVV